MNLLANKNIIVTGGSRGIGKGIVQTAMEEGANVAFTYLNSGDEAEAIVKDMTAKYPNQRCIASQCDVADTEEMEKFVKTIIATFERVDGLVNNAGITRDTVLARMSRNQWDSVINTNLGSMFTATKPLVLQMVKQRGGVIINMSSVVGLYGNSGQTNYAAAKAGMIGMSKALAAEVASRGITVNCVAPGFIATPMTDGLKDEQRSRLLAAIPAGRLGEPADIAAAVVYLASAEAAYVTGQTLHVNGGMAMI